MAPSVARPLLRSPVLRQLVFRRFESTAANKAAEKATEATKDAAAKAKEFQAKAAEGLSRVSSAAGPAIAGAARGLTNALGKVGGRTGQLVNTIEKHTPTAVYYGKVTAETAKLVFHAQKMAPPNAATFQSYYEALWNGLRSGTLIKSPQALIQQARNLSNAQLLAGGVIFAECLGFFTVGEMIGRFKLIGYRGQTAAHH
ncbi:ATP synthase subunit g [Cladobotryum mycophilum]|uniref:ATP synthase subunit g n=1 Tax=Cladobotryum mycophilum TaxID=491253 RepID=A0ABR0SM43_9HYPO